MPSEGVLCLSEGVLCLSEGVLCLSEEFGTPRVPVGISPYFFFCLLFGRLVLSCCLVSFTSAIDDFSCSVVHTCLALVISLLQLFPLPLISLVTVVSCYSCSAWPMEDCAVVRLFFCYNLALTFLLFLMSCVSLGVELLLSCFSCFSRYVTLLLSCVAWRSSSSLLCYCTSLLFT